MVKNEKYTCSTECKSKDSPLLAQLNVLEQYVHSSRIETSKFQSQVEESLNHGRLTMEGTRDVKDQVREVASEAKQAMSDTKQAMSDAKETLVQVMRTMDKTIEINGQIEASMMRQKDNIQEHIELLDQKEQRLEKYRRAIRRARFFG